MLSRWVVMLGRATQLSSLVLNKEVLSQASSVAKTHMTTSRGSSLDSAETAGYLIGQAMELLPH